MAILPVMPASAATSTLTINVQETMARADTYTPNLPTGGTTAVGGLSGTGTVTITNTLTTTDLYDVTVNLVQGATLTPWTQTSGPAAVIGAPTGSPATIPVHIAKIGHGQSVVLSYIVDPAAAHLPIALTSSYSLNKIPAVVAPTSATTVTMTLTKDETTSGSCTISNIAVKVSNAIAATPNVWTFSGTATGSGTISVDGTNNVNWAPANMAPSASPATATYVATISNIAPFTNVQALSLYNMAQAYVSYQINGGTVTASGVSVSGSPTAVTQNVGTDLTKAFLPGTGYQFWPQVNNNQAAPDNVDFTLSSVNFWIVDSANPTTAPTNQQTITTGLPATITPGNNWRLASPVIENVAYVPAGFLKPTISIADSGNQITRTIASSNGISGSQSTVTLMKTIYILNGYQIEVTKTVAEESANPGHFDITLTVKNTGTKTSPNVYVYDIVPSDWYNVGTSPYGMSPAALNNGPVNNPVAGQAYWWNEGQIAAGATATVIHYSIIGPANYQLSEVYVVGVDPAQSMNIQTTPNLDNVASMVNANFESLAALGALALVVVGMFGTYRRRF